VSVKHIDRAVSSVLFPDHILWTDKLTFTEQHVQLP